MLSFLKYFCLFSFLTLTTINSNQNLNIPIFAENDQLITSNCIPVFYPAGTHFMYQISALSDAIVIEDNSLWSFDYYHYYDNVSEWSCSDILIIEPNTSWFSSHKYRIVNKTINRSIPVTLERGPDIDGENSLQILSIDYIQRTITLSDNSQWEICSCKPLYEWRIGHYIIIGKNNSYNCDSNFILINSNMYNHVNAQKY